MNRRPPQLNRSKPLEAQVNDMLRAFTEFHIRIEKIRKIADSVKKLYNKNVTVERILALISDVDTTTGSRLDALEAESAYKDHVCQCYASIDQATSGATVLNFTGEDKVDAGYTHAAGTPHQITVNKKGWYRVTIQVNNDTGHRTRVMVGGVVKARAESWDIGNKNEMVQAYAASDQAISGTTILNFASYDKCDSIFTHAAGQITVGKTGWYRVTYGINNDTAHRTRILKNGAAIERSIAWNQ